VKLASQQNLMSLVKRDSLAKLLQRGRGRTGWEQGRSCGRTKCRAEKSET
jgi:hypothetical protein